MPAKIEYSATLNNLTPITIRHKVAGAAARLLAGMPSWVFKALMGKPIQVDGKTLDPHMQFICRNFHQPDDGDFDLGASRAGGDIRATWLGHRLDRSVPISELTLPGPRGPIRCEQHKPKNVGTMVRGIVYFHGGAHVEGSSQGMRHLCNRLAKDTNSIVISVDYRLAPENQFPVGVEDCLAAYDVIAESVQELGIDPAKLAVAGDSAGGNCAAVVANERRSAPVAPCLQLLWYPWLDMVTDTRSYDLFGSGFMLEKTRIETHIDRYLPNRKLVQNPMVSPLRADVAGVCPGIVIAAGFDPLLDEDVAYAEKLKQADVPVTLRVYDDLIHGFANMSGHVSGPRQAWEQIMSDVNRLMP